jgi:hypothetical protein
MNAPWAPGHAITCPAPQGRCICGAGLREVAPRHEDPRRSPSHDALGACPECGAPPRELCVGRDGKALPSTFVHRKRLVP